MYPLSFILLSKPNEIRFNEGSLILIDKPLNITSFGVVKQLKWAFSKKSGKKRYKVGHAGTLDPLASGLLIVCAGKKTKEISQYQGLVKEYTGIITIGATTPSYDLETEIDKTFDTDSITEEQIKETALSFVGENEQLPPVHSAKKIDGKRAYNYARNGEEVEMKPSIVHIHAFDVTKIEGVNIHFRIECSKGTYIRSIAYDFGNRLNNGAHLSKLRRTKIGDFKVEDALQVDEAKKLILDTTFIPETF